MEEWWCSCHTLGKLTSGPIFQKHGVEYYFKSLYLCTQILSSALILEKKEVYLCTSITEKAPKASAAPRDQTALNKEWHYWLLIAVQASHLLHQSHFCQPWQSTTAHLLGAREKVHASFPLNPLALFSCSWFVISIFVRNLLLVDLREHLLSEQVPCHPYLIKNIMDTWLCVWLDSFKN